MANTNDDIKEAIEALLDDYLDSSLNKSDIDDKTVDEDDIKKAKDKDEDSDDDKKSKKMKKESDEDDDDEEDEEDEAKNKKKCKKSLKMEEERRYHSKEDMIPDPNGDLQAKKGKGMKKTEIKKSVSEGLSEDERTELESYRKKEKEVQAELIQKSIQAEKDAQEKRFGAIEDTLSGISDNLNKMIKGPAYRRLSKSGTEDLSKAKGKEEIKETSINDVVLAKSHPEASRVLEILFAMQKENLAKAKDIICFENTGNVADPEVKRVLVGKLKAA